MIYNYLEDFFYLKKINADNFYNLIINNINKIFINNLPFNIQFKILFLKNKFLFQITNITNSINLDYIQEVTSSIKIYLPYILYKVINNSFNIVPLFITELPLIDTNNTLILNGVKRTFISKLIQSDGIFIENYKKENTVLYYLKLNIKKENIKIFFILDLIDYTFNIQIQNTTINIIHFMYYIGIFNIEIISKSRYGNSLILNKLLEISTINFIKFSKSYYINNYLLLITNIINNIYLEELYTSNYLILILDLLLDLNINKINIINKDNFGKKSIISILNTTINYIEFIINNLLTKNFIYNKYKIKINNQILLYKEQLLINPLLRFTDDINIITELNLSNKIDNSYNIDSSLINTSTLTIRDFNYSQLHKFSILDTSEGPNSGLILSLTLNTSINLKNQLVSYHYNKYNLPVTTCINNQELYNYTLENYYIKKGLFFNKFNLILFKHNNIIKLKQCEDILITNLDNLLNISETLIPFILQTDPTRSFMGAKMQTQAVPLVYSKHSLILTGKEFLINSLYNNNIITLQEGVVVYVSSYKIIIRDIFNRDIIYYLTKNKASNSSNIKYYTPIVWVGERVSIGQLLADNNSTNLNELSLGTFNTVIFGSYFGYEYEDSIIISQQLIYENIFTSLHIDIYKINFNYNKDIIEYSTLNIPNTSIWNIRNLDSYGIIKEGSVVLENDILINKVIKTKLYLNNNINTTSILSNLIGNEYHENFNTSLKVPKGGQGRILKVEVFTKCLFSNLTQKSMKYINIRLYISKLRILEIGDKLCGRHGNKGIISYISKKIDLPFTSKGIIPDIITSSLGIPSRLNIGQLYEGLLGICSLYLDNRYIIENTLNNILGVNYIRLKLYSYLNTVFKYSNFKNYYNPYQIGTLQFKEGRSGSILKGNICMGVLQYFKLIHMVKDKLNYRTIGDYSKITQQPIRGRMKGGGQRFGEMETWALESYGVSYTIRELYNYRSDDITGRASLYHMYTNALEKVRKIDISETFKITIKELQSLSLDINTFVVYPEISNILKYSNITYNKNESL